MYILFIQVFIIIGFVTASETAGKQLDQDYRYKRSSGITSLDLFEDVITQLPKHLPCLSCKGRCGISSIWQIEDFDDERGACACNLDCLKFGNCCPDIIHMCPELGINMSTIEIVTIPTPSTECYDKGIGFGEGMYSLINTCPHNNHVCQRTNKCVKTAIPVVDLETKLSYSNTLCALCNGVTNLTAWEIKNKCIDGNCDVKTSDFFSNWTSERNSMVRFHPPGFTPTHWCLGEKYQNTLIDRCNEKWPIDYIRKACESKGQSFTFYEEEIETEEEYNKMLYYNYKNYFCAICNFQNVNRLNCLYGIHLVRGIDPEIYSMQKLFSVENGSGLSVNALCDRGQVFIEAGQRCLSVDELTLDQVIPSFQMNMNLPIDEQCDLPYDRANHLLLLAEKKEFHIDFHIGECHRNWKQGVDYLNIGGKQGLNSTENFLNEMLIISKLWQESQKYKKGEINLKISILDNECVYLTYNYSDVTFDKSGIASHNEWKRRPGKYFILNNTVYICQNQSVTNWLYSPIIGWITMPCMSASMFSLLLYILHSVCSSLPNRQLFLLSCCLLLSHFAFLVGPELSFSYPLCYAAGVILHWRFVSSFSWMSAIAFDLFYRVSSAAKLQKACTKKLQAPKLLFPFLFPCLVLISSLAVEESGISDEWRPQYGKELCWFNSNNALLVFFVAPVAVYVTLTAVFTIVTSIRMWFIIKQPIGNDRNKVVLFLRLSMITGLSWIFGFVAVPTRSVILFCIFVVLNASQGFFLLVAVLFPKIRSRFQAKEIAGNAGTINSPT